MNITPLERDYLLEFVLDEIHKTEEMVQQVKERNN